MFDYPLVYPKGNGERLAVYLAYSHTLLSFVAAIYLCGAAIFWCLILGQFFRFQSIRLYSIAILLRPASQQGIESGVTPPETPCAYPNGQRLKLRDSKMDLRSVGKIK